MLQNCSDRESSPRRP